MTQNHRLLFLFFDCLWQQTLKNTLVEMRLSGFQVTANEKNVETRKDKHLMEQYFWNVKIIISCQRATRDDISKSPENVVRFVTMNLFCMTSWQQTWKQISNTNWYSFLFFFPISFIIIIIIVIFCRNLNTIQTSAAIWCLTKPRVYVSYLCSVIIQHSPYSTVCFSASLRMQRIRQPS